MTAGRAPESPRPPRQLSIGELAERTGVAATALRYYEQLGLLRPAARSSGRRRYDPSAVADVGAVRFLREVGLALGEIGTFLTGDRQPRRELIDRKLAQVIEQQHRLDVARAALEHAQRCPAGDPLECTRFWAIIGRRRDGASLDDGDGRAPAVARGDAASPTG